MISLRPHTEMTLRPCKRCYARDNKTKGKLKVVLDGKRKIVGVDGVTDEEDYMGY